MWLCRVLAGATVLLILLCSGRAFSAQAARGASWEDGATNQNTRAEEVPPAEGLSFSGQSGGTVRRREGLYEESPAEESTQGANRRPVFRRRSTTSRGLFTKHLGTGSKVLLTVSMVVGTVFMLSQLGRLLWACLAGVVGGLEPHDGSTPRSLSHYHVNNTCEPLLGIEPGVNGNKKGSWPSTLARLGVRVPRTASDLTPVFVILFAIIVIALTGLLAPRLGLYRLPPETDIEDYGPTAAPEGEGTVGPYSPVQTTKDERPTAAPEGEGTLGPSPPVQTTKDERPTAAPEGEGTLDPYSPPVQTTKDEVIVGKGWKDEHGKSKQGEECIGFSSGQRRYTVYLSQDTEHILKNEGLLQRLRDALSKAPELEGEILVWGSKGEGFVLGYEGTISAPGPRVQNYKVYVPTGALGVTGNDSYEGLGVVVPEASRSDTGSEAAASFVTETEPTGAGSEDASSGGVTQTGSNDAGNTTVSHDGTQTRLTSTASGTVSGEETTRGTRTEYGDVSSGVAQTVPKNPGVEGASSGGVTQSRLTGVGSDALSPGVTGTRSANANSASVSPGVRQTAGTSDEYGPGSLKEFEAYVDLEDEVEALLRVFVTVGGTTRIERQSTLGRRGLGGTSVPSPYSA